MIDKPVDPTKYFLGAIFFVWSVGAFPVGLIFSLPFWYMWDIMFNDCRVIFWLESIIKKGKYDR